MKLIIKSLHVFLLCMVMLLSARALSASDATDANMKQRAASAIFNDIMQTLPSDMKAKVDSAGMNRKSEHPVSSVKGRASADSHSSGQSSLLRRDAAVGLLPEDVRGQVEKAIADIDLMNQNRQIQFKEYEKKHPGPR